jgi:hypothetical protein
LGLPSGSPFVALSLSLGRRKKMTQDTRVFPAGARTPPRAHQHPTSFSWAHTLVTYIEIAVKTNSGYYFSPLAEPYSAHTRKLNLETTSSSPLAFLHTERRLFI